MDLVILAVDPVILAAVSIAVVHSLAPDHYLPFTIFGRLKSWGAARTLLFSGLAGTLHVGTSAVLGVALLAGVDLLGCAELVEKTASWLLIAFGLIYALVSLLRRHHHPHSPSLAALLLILGLSPCIPLVPLILVAESVAAVIASFGVATVATILTLTYLSFKAFKPPKALRGREDFAAGMLVAAVGFATRILGMRHEGDERGGYRRGVLEAQA